MALLSSARLQPRVAWTILVLVGVSTGLGPGLPSAQAICPSKPPRAAKPVPPELREPFDPPTPEPDELPVPVDPGNTEPPVTPDDPAPPPAAPPGPAPTTPPAAPAPPTTPRPPADGPTTRRPVGVRGLDALDDCSWELWWALNRSDVLPQVRRQTDGADAQGYARTLTPELRPAVDVLLSALEDADDLVRYAALGALAVTRSTYRSADTVEALGRVLDGRDLYGRDLAGLALARRGEVDCAAKLRRVLRNGHEAAVSRAFAALSLIELGDAEGLELVAEATRDLSEPDVAGAALIGLGQTRNLKYLPLLMEAAQRRHGAAARVRRVRADALIGLGKLGAPATIPFLGELLADREKVIARAAALALGGMRGDDGAARALAQAGLASEDAFVRGFSAVSLGRVGEASAVPALMPRLNDEQTAVPPFVLLGTGLLKARIAAPFLRAPLLDSPRGGRTAAAALATGLAGAPDLLALLVPAVEDVRTSSVPACGALGLALLGAKEQAAVLRRRFWLDGARTRPGFPQALALLDPQGQSEWLLAQLARTRRSGARQALVEALALSAGPAEAGALVELWGETPRADTALRVRLVGALTAMVNDRETSFARRLLLHSYYLQPNIVLNHLATLP